RIRRRRLDVRPVDVFACEGQVGIDRVSRVVGVADDEAADDEHAVPVQDVDSGQRRVLTSLPRLAAAVLGRRLQEREVVLGVFFSAGDTYTEPGRGITRR